MTRVGAGALALSIVIAASACNGPPSGLSGTFDDPLLQRALDHRVIVHLDQYSTASPQEVLERNSLVAERLFETPSYRGFSVILDDQSLADLRNDPDTAVLCPDQPIYTNGFFENTPMPTPQVTPTGITRTEDDINPIANIGNGTSVDADVAIIDSGLGNPGTRMHDDLNIAGGENFVKKNPGNPPDPLDWGDANGHGTHVAGTIGAMDNGFGVVGVAPGARLWGLRVFADTNAPVGSGSFDTINDALAWVENRADQIEVVNMSLGGPLFNSAGTLIYTEFDDSPCTVVQTTDAFRDAICGVIRSGVTVVVAAGNDEDDASRHIPAAYDDVVTVAALSDFDGEPGGQLGVVNNPVVEGVFIVGYTTTPPGETYCRPDQDDSLADFSNFGSDVDIMAPGVCIYSTWRGEKDRENTDGDIWYDTISGTSMASPHVAGAAAVYRAQHPAASPAEVRDALVAWSKPEPYLGCDAYPANDPTGNCGGFSLMHMGLLDEAFETKSITPPGTRTTEFDPIPPAARTFDPNNTPEATQIQNKAGSTQPLTIHAGGAKALAIGYVDTGAPNENAAAELCLPDTAANHIQASFSIFLDNFVDFNAIAIVSDDPDAPLDYHYLVDAAGNVREESVVSSMGATGGWHEVIIDIDRTSGTSTLTIDGTDATSSLGVGWPTASSTEPMKCLRIVTWIDTTQSLWIDNVTVLSWDND